MFALLSIQRLNLALRPCMCVCFVCVLTDIPVSPMATVNPTPEESTDGKVKAVVHQQYNSPINIYAQNNIKKTLDCSEQVLQSHAEG